MKHALRNVAAGSLAAALLMGASSLAANASYLGYGNGDPGNWSFYQEQHPHLTKMSTAKVQAKLS
jgi:carbohydrate-selective porin OprB